MDDPLAGAAADQGAPAAPRRPLPAVAAAPLLVIALAALFQVGSALATHVISGLGVFGALWVRTASGAVVLAALRPRALRLPSPGQRVPLLLLSLSVLGMNLAFYAAISYVPLGVAVTVEFLGPLAVAVGGMRRKLDALWIALALGGVFLLAGPTSTVSLAGLGFALLAGASWAAYLLYAKRALADQPPLELLTLILAVDSVLLTPVLIPHGARLGAYPREVALGIGVGVVFTAFPYVLELVALRLVRAATYGILLSLEPAVGALAGFLLLGQRLAWPEVGAILAVMVAAAGASWSDRPQPGPERGEGPLAL
jgi:inner membrane transporter RhtA